MSSVRGHEGPPPTQVGLADLQAAGDLLGRLSAGLVPEDAPLGEAPAWWAAIERIVHLGGSLQTLFARRVDEARAWQRAGYRSAAEQLAALGGTTLTQARSLLEASQQLAELPAVSRAVRAGGLSAAQTFAVAAGAAADPEAEKSLLATARRSSLAELRAESLRVKAAADPDPDATHRRLHAERRLSWRTDAEGAFCLSARGTVDDGARITTALEPIIDRFFVEARRRGEPEPREAYAFDALVAATTGQPPDHDDPPGVAGSDSVAPADTGQTPDIDTADPTLFTHPGAADSAEPDTAPTADRDDTADRDGTDPADRDGTEPTGPTVAKWTEPDSTDRDDTDLAHPTDPTVETDPSATSTNSSGDGRGNGRGQGGRVDPRFLALLRVDYSALVRGEVAGDETCEIAGLGPIPATTARQLLPEAVIKLVITKGVDVCNVTHLGRGPTAAQRVALAWNSPACEVPGCPRQRVEIDHTQPWAHTHTTRLDQLDPLCHHHHALKHHDHWAFTTDPGPRDFVPPTHPRHPANGGAPASAGGEGAGKRDNGDGERGPP